PTPGNGGGDDNALTNKPDHPVGAAHLAVFADYEGPEKTLFAQVLKAGEKRVMLDIGANVGVHSLCFARVMQQVVAFEPNPEVFVR
ncbi:FkbM family methyltransferase, partial [Aeromonas veronii]|uniref:FkbM family methyltransferase n=1 Tax=Aeromonas veronii TaxID=654 RepID=UPI00406CE3AA